MHNSVNATKSTLDIETLFPRFVCSLLGSNLSPVPRHSWDLKGRAIKELIVFWTSSRNHAFDRKDLVERYTK